jgi:hypothetical protein
MATLTTDSHSVSRRTEVVIMLRMMNLAVQGFKRDCADIAGIQKCQESCHLYHVPKREQRKSNRSLLALFEMTSRLDHHESRIATNRAENSGHQAGRQLPAFPNEIAGPV